MPPAVTCRTLLSLAAGAAVAPAAARTGAGPQSARQGLVRHQLGGRGRARRLLPGARRRHLPEIRPRRHHRAGRAEREQPHPAARSARSISSSRANTLQGFDAVEQNVPMIEVAALVPEGPAGADRASRIRASRNSTDLKNLTLFISKEGMASYFQWLKADYGFTESQVKPYTFNPQPFLADKKSAMQGYVTSEPFAIEKAAHFKPKVFLLADQGFSAYSTLIETRRDLVDKKPDWCSASSMPRSSAGTTTSITTTAPANALIKKQNPEMTDDLLAYSVAKMKQYGIVDSGDTLDARRRRHDRRAHEGLSSTRWCAPASPRPGSITANATRCNSSTRRSGLICGRNDVRHCEAAKRRSNPVLPRRIAPYPGVLRFARNDD